MIQTGKEPIKLTTYLAILSVCFIINLPGIVVTPMEGRLKEILHDPELEIQLLTILPNFVIIPFVLLSGKLSLCKHKIPWIISALILYLVCGVAYLFFNSMAALIVISCLLGCANGILIPFSMGFVVNTFFNKYRTRQLGIKSATSNLAVVIGSFIVGFLIESNNWHLPFIVYLAAIFPLIFCYWLKYVPGLSVKTSLQKTATVSSTKDKKIDIPKVWGLIGNNVFLSFMAMAVVIYLPQLIQNYGWNPILSGKVISIFFISVLAAGIILLPFVRLLKHFTFFGISILLLAGIAIITFIHQEWAFYVGSVCVGMAFGFFQPFIYDKTSYTVTDQSQSIRALSYVLTALYTAIALESFIIEGICILFKIKDVNKFAFLLCFFMAICYSILALILRKKFAFSVEKAYIAEAKEMT